MKISGIYNLDASQAELDFIDIDIERDIALFLDPFFLSIREDNFSLACSRTIRSFFQRVIDLVRNEHVNDARELFNHLHEPNSTCLGMSKGRPQGRGVGRMDTTKIFNRIIESRAIQTGLLRDLEDSVLFVDQFDKDKLSDMTTNIIRKHLIEYTNNQCKLHGIELREGVPSGFYWNSQFQRWESEHCEHLVINDRPILLVPKGIVSFKKQYTARKYYQHFVLNYLQNENLQLNTALVEERADGTRYVTKKSIKERNPFTKDFLREFTRLHPEVLQDFKDETEIDSLTNWEIADLNLNQICMNLIARLQATNSGTEDATAYHKIIKSILELIFYPSLINPVLEQEIHEGRKRIDISFDNAAGHGIFHRLSHNMNLPCPYIFIECKNYSSDPVNPELDQLSGRFSPNRGRVGFLLCRNLDNEDLFIRRCQDTYRDGRGLIIPLTDEVIIDIIRNHNNWNQDYVENILSNLIRRIMVI